MPSPRTALCTLLAVGVVSVPAALAATPSSPASSASAAPQSSPASTAHVPHVTVERPLTIALDSKGNLESNKLPTPSTLFTMGELKQAIPGLTSIQTSDDTLTLTIKGDSSNTLQIVLKRFGKKSDVQKAWNAEKSKHQQRARRDPGLYTFFGSRLGAQDAFTDGTNTHVLVTAGAAAGEIWFSGSGFTHLADSYNASRAQYTSAVTSAIVRLLADKATKGQAPQQKAS